MIKNASVSEMRSWECKEYGWHVSPSGDRVKLGERVTIGENVNVGDRVKLGERVTIGENVNVGNRVELGKESILGNWSNICDEVILCDNVSIGERVSVGKGSKLDNFVVVRYDSTIGERVYLGYSVVVGNGSKLGDWVKVGDNSILGDQSILGDDVNLGKGSSLGDWSKLGNKVNLSKGSTSEALNKEFIDNLKKQFGDKMIVWKWVTKYRMSPNFDGGIPLKYEKGAIIEEPNAIISYRQCDVGLHVLRFGYRPEWVGLCEANHNFIKLDCEVMVEDICFGGLPTMDAKLRVKKLRVLE